MVKSKHLLLTAFCFCAAFFLQAQDSSGVNRVIAFPTRLFTSLDKKTSLVESKLDRQTNKYLHRLQKQEHKLRKKLLRKDSTLTAQMFEGVDKKYEQLKGTTGNVSKYASVYSGHLDSLTTALNFLKAGNLPNNAALTDLSGNTALGKTLSHYEELQQKLNASDQIRKQLEQREQMIKEQFEKLGMIRLMKQYRKQLFYYRQQVQAYKQTFEDPSKLEAKLMEVVMKLPQFKDFFAKNSLLGSLFSLPGSNAMNTTASLAGLQTRAMVNQSLINRFGSSSAVTQQLQQNVGSAQGQLNQLKNKISSYSSGSYGNADNGDIPDFKPNDQKTKSFLQRLEYGGNVQSQKARYFFPVTSDIALSLGYKINNKSSIGIGAAYKIGWGSNWSNIRLSHQGMGLRSYLDWKIKGSFYFSGGYEQNYRSMINSVAQLKDYSAWQTSGLIGVSKKYSISKKMKGEMKILWDFMSYQQVPKAQPILFRVGYSLK